MSYYIREDGQLAVAQIPKAGLNTMNDWLGGWDVVKNDDTRLLACPTRVMFIRNPIVRLQSAYSFMRVQADNGNLMKHGAPVNSWHPFVDYILENDNLHWTPQVKRTGNLQTVVHRLEDLGHIFWRYHESMVNHNNATRRRPVDNYRLADIVDYYMEDFNLWLGAEL